MKLAVFVFILLALFVFSCKDNAPPEAGNGQYKFEVNCDSIYIRVNGGSSFYEDNPTYYDNHDDSQDWTFSIPEAEGMNNSIITDGAKTIENSTSIFSLIIIRHNKIIFEKYYNGCTVNSANNIHSASKSILGAFTGIAIKNGLIDNEEVKLSSILPGYFSSLEDLRKNDISIKNLLTMTAGLYWVEDETEYQIENDSDWVASILNQTLATAPGTTFNYSSGLTHVLSAAIGKAAGNSLCQFSQQFLFKDLKFTVEHWGRDPKGNFSGGYNFYITARELAKFGLLYLNKGKYNDKQLVTADWVEKSLTAQIAVDEDYSYGYLWWLRKIHGYKAAIAWGYGGQFAYLLPEADLLIVSTADTKIEHSEFDINAFVLNYIIPAIEE